MPDNLSKAIQIQRQYDTDTAAGYDATHAGEGDDDPLTLRRVCGFLRMIEARTFRGKASSTPCTMATSHFGWYLPLRVQGTI